MEDIININGVEYIRKDCIAKKVGRILTSTQRELDSLIDSYKINNEIETAAKPSRLKDSGITVKPKQRRRYRKGSDRFEPNDFAKKEYKILGVNDDGSFRILGSTSKNSFNIKQVIKIRNKLNEDPTMDESKRFAEYVGVSYSQFMKISYNIKIGTFDKHIKEYINNLEANQPLKKRKVEIQNNPEKRREMGLS